MINLLKHSWEPDGLNKDFKHLEAIGADIYATGSPRRWSGP
jgi:hypothetical protein